MKKIFLLAAAGFVFCCNLSAQLLCGSYDDFDARFNYVGSFHNSCLTNIKSNLSTPSSITTKSAAIDYIKDFTKSYYNLHKQEYFPSPMPPIQIDSIFENSKRFVDNEDFKLGLITTGSGWCLDDCIDQVNNSGLIDSANMQIFQTLVSLAKNSADEESSSQLESGLIALANNWLTVNEGKTGNGKELTGNIIAVGLKSCEWWNQNPDAAIVFKQLRDKDKEIFSGPFNTYNFSEDEVIVFPWLADLAGVIVGGALYTIVQGPNFSWEHLGQAALGGAVSSSGGLVNKVIRWFKNLF